MTFAPPSTRNAAVAVPTMPPPMTATSIAGLTRASGRGGQDGRRGRDLREGGKEAVDFRGGVVVGEPDPNDPIGSEPEALHEPRGVEVAVPDGDAGVAETLRDVARRMALDRDRRGRRPSFDVIHAKTEEAYARNPREATSEPSIQLDLVATHAGHPRDDPGAL